MYSWEAFGLEEVVVVTVLGRHAAELCYTSDLQLLQTCRNKAGAGGRCLLRPVKDDQSEQTDGLDFISDF